MRALSIVLFSFILACARSFPSSGQSDRTAAGLMLASNLAARCEGLGFCKVFGTTTVMPDMGGSPNGITGADARCNSDANKPAGSGIYRALLSGTNRTATVTANLGDGQTGWVLYPDTEYRRADGQTVFRTNSASLFVFGTAQGFIAAAGNFHTGFQADWTTGPNCNSWTDATGAANGRYGTGGVTGNTLISLSQSACNTARGIYCVQQ